MDRPRRKGAFYSEEPSRTIQSFRNETDLGNQIRAMMKLAQPDPRIPRVKVPGTYQGPGSVVAFDCSAVPDFHEAQNRVAAAQRFFDSLPLNVKKLFEFNPSAFYSALVDPAQRQVLVEAGVFNPPEKPKPVPGSKESPLHVQSVTEVEGGGGGEAPPVSTKLKQGGKPANSAG